MRIFNGLDEIKSAAGSEIGVSDWIEITQDRINRFAEATCDEQWIHVDQERAKTELPGGKDHCARHAFTRARATVHTIGGRSQGRTQHPQLRSGPDSLSGAGAGGREAAWS